MTSPGSSSSTVALVKRVLWSGEKRGLRDSLQFQGRAHDRAILVVRLFYGASLLWIVRSMARWTTLLEADAIDPQWPAAWLSYTGLDRGVPLILAGYALAGVLCALLPQWRIARFGYAVFLLQFMALENGFGKINHNMHSWLFVALLLIALPDRSWHDRRRVSDRLHFSSVILACQLVVLFFYALTGFWKLFYAVHALFLDDRMSSFAINGFSYILANRIVETNQQTVLGEALVAQPILGWAMFNLTVYLETVSVVIAFRPRLHRLWGIGLILFHIGTQLTMGFTFHQNILLVGILLLCSPVAPDAVRFWAAASDLPGVHWMVRRRRRGARPSPAPLPRPATVG